MKMLRITLEGKTYEVGVEVLEDTPQSAPLTSHLSATPQPASHTAAAAPTPPPQYQPAEGEGFVCSPMAGQVFKCLVKPGDQVTINQVLLVLDAMKMETPVVSTFAGRVRSVMVKEGDAVEEGKQLVQIDTAQA